MSDDAHQHISDMIGDSFHSFEMMPCFLKDSRREVSSSHGLGSLPIGPRKARWFLPNKV